jgi:DNA-binding MarR family transcriptional regulator
MQSFPHPLHQKPMNTAYSSRWGTLTQIQIPNALFKDDRLSVSSAELSVLLVLLTSNRWRKVKESDAYAAVGIGHQTLIQRTGLSRDMISRAIKDLIAHRFIQNPGNRNDRGEFVTPKYILCNPADGAPLKAAQNPCYQSGLRYFTAPTCIVSQVDAHWSLANLPGSAIKLYVSALYLANRAWSNEFSTYPEELMSFSGIKTKTAFEKSIRELEMRGLVEISGNCTQISLCDPYSGWPLEQTDGGCPLIRRK